MRPGMRVGKEARGFRVGYTRKQAFLDVVIGGGAARIEPGEHVGRGAERGDQRTEVIGPGGGVGGARGGGVRMRMRAAIGIGLIWCVLPGGVEERLFLVLVSEPAVRAHPCVFPSCWNAWASMTDLRRFGEDWFITWWVFAGRDGPPHEHVRSRQAPYVR